MTQKLFGTDGIRGKANVWPVTADMALRVAQAAAVSHRRGKHRHTVVIGKDTRLSGYMLESAMTAGFLSMGMDVVLVGPLPTPAVAMLTQSLRADMGVMISASHNPYQDNGIKIFGADGYKLSDATEEDIEKRLEQDAERVPADQVGRARRLEDESGRYIEFVKQSFPKELSLEGLKIVVDCANGAAYKAAPRVLYELGAEVIPVGVTPDGKNINQDCGATKPALMQETVVTHSADIGIALDGDADRLIVCDEKGHVIDGDQLMALIAKDWHKKGLLKGDVVVATVMSNLGFQRFLENMGVALRRMPVGDRYVVDHMRAGGFNLGGEQSGHIILGDYATTGDGLLAALQVLRILCEQKKPASALCRVFTPVPQVLKNVRYENNIVLESDAMQTAIQDAEKKLGDTGRLLVRKSGTEPLVRVMAEGDELPLIESVVNDVCMIVKELGGQCA